MKKHVLIAIIAMLSFQRARAQVFTMDTLQFNGEKNKMIDLVILGDGYTSVEQDKMKTDTQNFINYLFGQSPWSNYKDYFNIYLVKVVSHGVGNYSSEYRQRL